MLKNIALLSTAFIFMALLACATRPVTEVEKPLERPLESEVANPVEARAQWEVEWEKTLDAAQKEGKVVLYGDVLALAVREAAPIFKKKYGITLEILAGTSGELAAKILQERRAGLYLADIFMPGMNTYFDSIKPAGVAAPIEPLLILPEVLDETAWYEGKFPWGAEDRRVIRLNYYPVHVIGYNTELVKPGEINSYYDLLNPKWKGKIVLRDPTSAGAFAFVFTSIMHKILDWDFFGQLVKQEPEVLRDRRLMVDWIAKGKYPIGFLVHSETLLLYKKEGAPIEFAIAKEGTYITGGNGYMVFVDKAPHPNASKIFINWFLSREGTTFVHKVVNRQSTRIDISTEGVDPLLIREPKQKYFIAAQEVEKWQLEEAGKNLEMAKKIFAPLLK